MTRLGRLVLALAALWAPKALADAPHFQHVARFDPPTPSTVGNFGRFIEAEGKWAVISEYKALNANRRVVGLVHVLELRDGTWQFAATLRSPDAAEGEWFGSSIALSGDTIAVGNPDRTCGGGLYKACGTVYLFTLRDGTWQYDHGVVSPIPAQYDNFGDDLDLDGDTLVVHARGKKTGVVSNAGTVEVFARTDGVFRHQVTLQAEGIAASANYGQDLVLSGDTMLVPASSDYVDGTAKGAVYVLRRQADQSWVHEARITDPTLRRMPDSVAIRDDLFFVGCSYDDNGNGAIQVYRRAGGEVQRVAKITDPAPGLDNGFGSRFVVTDDRLITSSQEDTPDNYTFESVQVFARSGASVTWLEEFKAPVPVADREFGRRLAITGRYLFASAFDDDTLARGAGAVHVFDDGRGSAGEACGGDEGCLTGHCVDGVCCDSACGGSASDCMACRAELTGAIDGQCAPVLAGAACGDTSDTACSAPDRCDGAGVCAPNHAEDGSACDDGLFCSAGETCLEGLCTASASSPCDGDTACSEAEHACLPVCGNGVLQDGEACDDGAQNSDSAADACRTNCERARCGDGTVDTAEQCDDGAANSDQEPDACRTSCSLSRCGDGVIDAAEGCDDGAANSDVAPGACRTSCAPARCGDGVLDADEQCDEGAANADGVADACRTTCVPASCGDGVVDQGEACDEGRANSDVEPDRCRAACTAPRCGDGVVDQGEACDDAGENAACSAACTVPACAGGACDDAGMPDAGHVDGRDAGSDDAGVGDDAGTAVPVADAGHADGAAGGGDHDAGSDDGDRASGCTVTMRGDSAPSGLAFGALGAALALRRRRRGA